jgi:HAD superfamily hydrolase (TIGR01509 family)
MNATRAPDWKQVETVLLDMDGTLLDLAFDNRFWRELVPQRLAEARGTDLETAWSLLVPLFEATHGTLDWYCLEYWSRELGLDLAALKRAVRHEIAWLPRAREFLERLRRSGRRVVLVTNAHPETLAIKDAHLDLGRRFDAVYSSHGFGLPKEDAGFWSRLAAVEPFRSDASLFADDSLPVLRAARSHGLEQVFAIRRPDSRVPARRVDEFPSVEAVHELAEGLGDGPGQG